MQCQRAHPAPTPAGSAGVNGPGAAKVTGPAGRQAVLAAAREAADVAAAHAVTADRDAAFPAAAMGELARTGLLAAALPVELGGLDCDLTTLVEVARTLARGCGSTAMIWAMHQVQVACVARHCEQATPPAQLLAKLVAADHLIASATSEEGIGGNIRISGVALLGHGPTRSLDKRATTVSYGLEAGGYLVTARRAPDAPPGDQVAVLVPRDQVTVDVIRAWNPMGMRATASPALRLRATFEAANILPEPFASVAATTMVPLSHLLWSAVWIGLATEAFERARQLLRSRHRAGTGPVDPRLAAADTILTGLTTRLAGAVRDYHACHLDRAEPQVSLGVTLNALKVAASEDSLRVAERALEICGMAGYREDGEHSIARILRDLYSARLMIANDRLLATNATALLAVRRG
jgi:acyl-CoA dehydrogenase